MARKWPDSQPQRFHDKPDGSESGQGARSTSSFTMRVEGRCSSRPSDVHMVCVTSMYQFRMVADNAAGRCLVTLNYAPPFSTVPFSTTPVIWRDFPCE
jgi:hypothetical protein